MLVPLYILSPASRSGENNGLFIYDEAYLLVDSEQEGYGNFVNQDQEGIGLGISLADKYQTSEEGDGIGISSGYLEEGHGIAIDNHGVCMSDLNGRLCPLIQGVDYASISIDSQNPG